MEGEIIKRGWLVKRALKSARNWKKRYFVFRNNALLYYDSAPKDPFSKPKGLVELTDETVVRVSPVARNFAFEVVARPELLVLQASSVEDRDEWMRHITEAVDKLKDDSLAGKLETRRGWLTKRAVKSGRNWKRRFFVLRHGRLCYFDQPATSMTEKPRGVVELTSRSVVKVLAQSSKLAVKPNSFCIKADKDLYLSAETKDEMDAWVNILERAILRKNGIVGEPAVRVALWLREADLRHYAKPFIQHGYSSFAVLSAMSEDDIAEATALFGFTEDEEVQFARMLFELQKIHRNSVMGGKGGSSIASVPRSLSISASSPPGTTRSRVLSAIPSTPSPRSNASSAERRLYCWGDATSGKLGLASLGNPVVHSPAHVQALRNKSEPRVVVAGDSAAASISGKDGSLYTWGMGGAILGLGSASAPNKCQARPHLVTALRSVPIQIVSVGSTYMAAVSRVGDLYTWGTGMHGQLAQGPDITELDSPRLVENVGRANDDPFVDACCGNEHLLCLTTKGHMYSCGSGADGRLGHGDEGSRDQLVLIQSMEGKRVGDIAVGDTFSLAVSVNKKDCYCWGSTLKGNLGAMVPNRMQPFAGERMIHQIDANGSMAGFIVGDLVKITEDTDLIDSATSVYLMGDESMLFASNADARSGETRKSSKKSSKTGNKEKKTGSNKSKRRTGKSTKMQFGMTPHRVDALEDQGIVQLSIGKTHVAALNADGQLFMWGSDTDGQLGTGYLLSVTRPHESIRVSGYRYEWVSCGRNTTCTIAVHDPEAISEHGEADGELVHPPPPPEESQEAALKAQQQMQAMIETLTRTASSAATKKEPDAEPDDKPRKRILPDGSKELGLGWLEHTDYSKNLKYYENERTGEVQWEPPTLSQKTGT